MVNCYKEEQICGVLGAGDSMSGWLLIGYFKGQFPCMAKHAYRTKSLSCDLQFKSQRIKTQPTLVFNFLHLILSSIFVLVGH